MATSILSIKGIGPATASKLAESGFRTAEDVAAATVEQLGVVPGFGSIRASSTIDDAKSLLGGTTSSGSDQKQLSKSAGSKKKVSGSGTTGKGAKKGKKDTKVKKDQKGGRAKKDGKAKKGSKDKKKAGKNKSASKTKGKDRKKSKPGKKNRKK